MGAGAVWKPADKWYVWHVMKITWARPVLPAIFSSVVGRKKNQRIKWGEGWKWMGGGRRGELGESCRGKKKRNKKVIGRFPRNVGFKPRVALLAQECHKTQGRWRVVSGASGTDAGDLICDASSALEGNAERQQAWGLGKWLIKI